MRGTEMKSKQYDFNVYVVDGVVRLSAYEMKYLDNPRNCEPVETNTDKFTTLEIPMTMAHYGEVAYLLEDANWHTPKDGDRELLDGEDHTALELRAVAIDGWQDYDAWVGGVEWYLSLPTDRLRDWVDGLPEYEAEPAHEWTVSSHEVFEQLRVAPERPVYAEVKCLNCEETYTVGKMW